jgi:hypothetical protein
MSKEDKKWKVKELLAKKLRQVPQKIISLA